MGPLHGVPAAGSKVGQLTGHVAAAIFQVDIGAPQLAVSTPHAVLYVHMFGPMHGAPAAGSTDGQPGVVHGPRTIVHALPLQYAVSLPPQPLAKVHAEPSEKHDEPSAGSETGHAPVHGVVSTRQPPPMHTAFSARPQLLVYAQTWPSAPHGIADFGSTGGQLGPASTHARPVHSHMPPLHLHSLQPPSGEQTTPSTQAPIPHAAASTSVPSIAPSMAPSSIAPSSLASAETPSSPTFPPHPKRTNTRPRPTR
jgi:hypothetical protein